MQDLDSSFPLESNPEAGDRLIDVNYFKIPNTLQRSHELYIL